MDTNKLPIDKIRLSLHLCGKDVQVDEVECIVASLVFRGFVKGYISHKVGFLVLSKKEPFPAVIP